MTAGIGALIIALTLGGLGIERNKRAPKPKDVMVYAPQDADHMLFLDWDSVVKPAWKTIQRLPNDKRLKSFPEAIESVKMVVGEATRGVSMVSERMGFHPIDDVRWAAVWLKYGAAGDPQFLVTARGAFGADAVTRLAQAAGKEVTQLGARQVVRLDENITLGQGPDGALLLGTSAWVDARIRATWQAVNDKGFTARVKKTLAKKPFFMLVSRPSPTTKTRFRDAINDPEMAFFQELIAGHEYASFHLTYNSLGWTWLGQNAIGAERAEMASEGLVDLMRAGHPASRGAVRLALAVLGSYTHEPFVKRILEHKKLILDLVIKNTGDGQFKAKVTRKGNQVSVEASGKKLSEVLPVAGFIPLVGAGAAVFMFRSKEAYQYDEKQEQQFEPKPSAPAPPKTRGKTNAPQHEPAPEDAEEASEEEAPGMDVNPVPMPIAPK